MDSQSAASVDPPPLDRPPAPPAEYDDPLAAFTAAGGTAFREGRSFFSGLQQAEAPDSPNIEQALSLPVPPPILNPPPAHRQAPNASARSHPDSDESGSGSEHEDSEDDEEQADTGWRAIEEDRSVPCTDELAYIESKDEHSALDYTYWEKQTFFDLNDPELVPIDSGRIDFLVECFNGTKEQPNNEKIMRSAILTIGGLDWRIKFYPKGDKSEYLSCYVECVSMQSPDFAEFEEFEHPPFPFMKGQANAQKRRSIAAQISILMYNPAEPRTNEFQSEAVQFHKKNPDFGWKYFGHHPRYDFHFRQHGQRQAILRDDKLAFSAYIRVVDDPTSCLWAKQDSKEPDHMIAATGLRPFTKSLQYVAAALPLLHFLPFRKFVQDLKPGTSIAMWLQPLLLKMYTRKRSAHYGTQGRKHDGDVVEMLWRLGVAMENAYQGGPEPAQFKELVGVFHAEKGSACGSNRLDTVHQKSIQAAIESHPKLIACPALLTLELQRQEHDKKERKWRKVTNKVSVDDRITVSGVSYTLFAFITHCGHLQSSRYNAYVRPQGPNKGWYAYQDGKVTRLTEKQARQKHSGTDSENGRSKNLEDGYDSPFSEHHGPKSEVTCAVMYVRDDKAPETFNAPAIELWYPPHLTQNHLDEPCKTSVHEYFSETCGTAFAHGREPISEAEHARLVALNDRIDQAVTAATPEPALADGEDVVMRDADDDSTYSIDARDTEPQSAGEDLDVGTIDWLGRAFYEGNFKDKRYHGGGHLIAVNGDEYLGSFKDGLYHGYGRMIYAATGDSYEGEWVRGQKHGKGKLVEHATGNVFEGGFQEDRKHGDFVLKGTYTDEDMSLCHVCYEREISVAMYDCGHVVCCRECAGQLELCPVCRKRVVSRLQLYGVKVSRC